jgi:uncharacterized protein YdiU (UPF0061 family)
VSSNFAASLGLTASDVVSDRFLRFFSGDNSGFSFKSWATPYALSIYGQAMTSNCPFGTGNGYGDGRAISVAEMLHPSSGRWEFQLKGGGPTPFRRSGDGRAVLRSSVREFLASEAMHHLGISTTRGLSLIASPTPIKRPWYSESFAEERKDLPTSVSDSRLAQYPAQFRAQIIEQILQESRDPDVMMNHQAAIACRVAPSFLRVGHFDLFARRALTSSQPASQRRTALRDLDLLVAHALQREFPGDSKLSSLRSGPETDLPSPASSARALALLTHSAEAMTEMVVGWLRVGYVQGNFNSDNCLVAGRTMDYGPFGFMERFEQHWNMWTGGGKHFAYINQPVAAAKNFETLFKSLSPLLVGPDLESAAKVVGSFEARVNSRALLMWGSKLGLLPQDTVLHTPLISALLPLLERSQADFTLFFRELGYVAAGLPYNNVVDVKSLVSRVDVFYKTPTATVATELDTWLSAWSQAVINSRGNSSKINEAGTEADDVATRMHKVNPKFVPREWMLIEAYEAAEAGDASHVHALQALFEQPYSEHSAAASDKFYRKAPAGTYDGLGTCGQTFMS